MTSISLAILLCAPTPIASVGEDIASLQPGEWYEIPNSKLSDAGVFPDPLPVGNTGVRSVIDAWSGGVFDTKRDALLIWGGGHADYSGNEIYAFDMSASFSWSRPWGPTASDIPTTGCHQAYPDGNPSSRHTYNHMAYMLEPHDALFNHGGSYWKDGQTPPYRATWHFDLQSREWHDKGEPEGSPGGGGAAYDPVTGLVFARGKYGMFEYNPGQSTWTKRYHDGAGLNSFPTGDIDPGNRKMVLIGNGLLHVFDLESYAYSTYTPSDLSGNTEVLSGESPGLAYDSALGVFVAWSGEPAKGIRPEDVYVIEPVTLAVERRPPATTNAVIPTEASPRGTYGRWRYVPSRNVFVLVNAISQSVFVYRLSEEGSGPVCGDGTCDPSEDELSCCGDCGAGLAGICCDNVPFSGDCCDASDCRADEACDPNAHTCLSVSPGDVDDADGGTLSDGGALIDNGDALTGDADDPPQAVLVSPERPAVVFADGCACHTGGETWAGWLFLLACTRLRRACASRPNTPHRESAKREDND